VTTRKGLRIGICPEPPATSILPCAHTRCCAHPPRCYSFVITRTLRCCRSRWGRQCGNRAGWNRAIAVAYTHDMKANFGHRQGVHTEAHVRTGCTLIFSLSNQHIPCKKENKEKNDTASHLTPCRSSSPPPHHPPCLHANVGCLISTPPLSLLSFHRDLCS
jgi:hypothetical protein